MKTPVIFVSLLAVAGTAVTAKSATAATSDESIKEGLKQAICSQDWESAIQLSSGLIASPNITPEHRQTLVDWRHRFMDYSRDKTRFDKIPDCEGFYQRPVDIKVQAYSDPTPSFSRKSTLANAPVCYMERSDGQMVDLNYMCNANDGSRIAPNVPPQAAVVLSRATNSADVWTRNIHFDNGVWNRSLRAYTPTSAITGNVHNSGTGLAKNIVVEATGYAEGRTPQTRQAVIPSISADDARAVTIDFGFSVPVDSWDVRIVSWE